MYVSSIYIYARLDLFNDLYQDNKKKERRDENYI